MNYNSEYLQNWIKTEGKILIEKILSSESLLQEVASQSVEHDNGFEKIVLKHRDEKNFGIRIHNWRPGMSDSNIHSHRWNMASFILDGGYFAADYKESDNGDIFTKYHFSPNSVENYTLTSLGNMCLTENHSQFYKKGDFYTMLQGDIHRITKVGEEGALTIILSWGENKIGANVYSQKSIETESIQNKLSYQNVRTSLEKTLNLI